MVEFLSVGEMVVERETVEEIKRYFDEKSEETRRHFDERSEETKRHFDEKSEEIRRHFDIVVEGQDAKIQLLAEGVGAKIDRLEARVGGVEGEVRGLTQVVQRLYSEVAGRLNEHETRINALENRRP
jgi:hypothetical protein